MELTWRKCWYKWLFEIVTLSVNYFLLDEVDTEQRQRLVYSFAFHILQCLGTPLIFSRRADGGVVFEVKSLLNLKLANLYGLKVNQA